MSLRCFGSVDKPEQVQETPQLEHLQGPRLSTTMQALDHWRGSVLQWSSHLLTVISEGDIVQPAVSAGQPHSLRENRRTWGANLLFQPRSPWSHNAHMIAETQGHASHRATSTLFMAPRPQSPPTQLPPAQEVPNCQATGIRGTHFPWNNSSRLLCVWGLNNNSLTVKLGERARPWAASWSPSSWIHFEHWLVIKFAYQTLLSKSPIKPRQIGNS